MFPYDNMVIACRGYYNDGNREQYIKIDKNENVLNVEIHKIERKEDNTYTDKLFTKKSFDLEREYAKYNEEVFLSCYWLVGEKELSDIVYIPTSNIGFEMYKKIYKFSDSGYIFGIWLPLHDNNKTFTVVVPKMLVVENKNAVVIGDNKETIKDSDMIKTVDVSYEKFYEKNNAKRKLLINVDANNSLSGLEPQVDIVTKLVLKIIERDPSLLKEIKDYFPLYESFVDCYNNNNIFNVKDTEKCLLEMQEQKGNVRKEQKEYYKHK